MKDGQRFVIQLIILKFISSWWLLNSDKCLTWKTRKAITKLQLMMLELYKYKLRMSLRHLKRKRKLIGMEDLVSSPNSGKISVVQFKCQYLELAYLKRLFSEFNHLLQNTQIVINLSFIFVGMQNAVNMLNRFWNQFILPLEAAITLLK